LEFLPFKGTEEQSVARPFFIEFFAGGGVITLLLITLHYFPSPDDGGHGDDYILPSSGSPSSSLMLLPTVSPTASPMKTATASLVALSLLVRRLRDDACEPRDDVKCAS
jgi:hypothetical protein